MSAENIVTDADSNTISTDSADKYLGMQGEPIKNCPRWLNLATMCEHYLVSDKSWSNIC